MAAAEAALRRIDKVLATPLTDPQEEAVRAEAAEPASPPPPQTLPAANNDAADDVMAGTRGDTALEPEPEPLRDRGAG